MVVIRKRQAVHETQQAKSFPTILQASTATPAPQHSLSHSLEASRTSTPAQRPSNTTNSDTASSGPSTPTSLSEEAAAPAGAGPRTPAREDRAGQRGASSRARGHGREPLAQQASGWGSAANSPAPRASAHAAGRTSDFMNPGARPTWGRGGGTGRV